MHHLLFYQKSPDYQQAQKPWQKEHVDYVKAAIKRGEIILAGNVGEPADCSAMLVFNTDSADVAEKFAKEDPYVINGVIKHWHVKAWHTL